MGTQTAPGPPEKRFAAYLDGLAKAAGHADRVTPLKACWAGLLRPGERQSVEPMAARLAPDQVGRTHQSLHHWVAEAPWRDQAVLKTVRGSVLSRMKENGPVVAWIVDDTGLGKKGTHSAGVARQSCGRVGQPENSRVAVSLPVATPHASLPMAWRLSLPESGAHDAKRRKAAGVPKQTRFQTKPEIALAQIRQALEQEVPAAPVIADSACGNDTQFRERITELGLPSVAGIHETTTVWRPGEVPPPKRRRKGKGRPPTRLQRDAERQPGPVKARAVWLPERGWKTVRWREGTRHKRRSRFAVVGVRPAHRDPLRSEPGRPLGPEEWWLVEWPSSEPEPTKYWLCSRSAQTKPTALVRLARQCWIIARDYEELKQELGLGHDEGRGWREFHHHATLGLAADGFLVIERTRFSLSARAGRQELRAAGIPPHFQPRGSPRARRTA